MGQGRTMKQKGERKSEEKPSAGMNAARTREKNLGLIVLAVIFALIFWDSYWFLSKFLLLFVIVYVVYVGAKSRF